MTHWAERSTLPGLRHYWYGAGYIDSPHRARMLYNRERHYWHPADNSGISMPWAVMDDYGDLVAVPGPNAWDRTHD